MQRLELQDLDTTHEPHGFDPDSLLARMQAFGYTTETMQFMLLPLIQEERDPVGSMGNDSSLACLSDKPRLIYDYFRQLFAQVTNPAIDSIREEVIMSLECYIGPEANLLETTAKKRSSAAPAPPSPQQRGIGGDQTHRLPRVESSHHRHDLGSKRGRGGPYQGDRPNLCRGGEGDRRRI